MNGKSSVMNLSNNPVLPKRGLLLRTKFCIPQQRSDVVLRPRLVEKLNAGMSHKLTLISAPAGFGKTTLVSQWLNDSSGGKIPAAWISLDESDDNPAQFLFYLVTALERIKAGIGENAINLINAVQPFELVFTTIINAVADIPEDFALVLDDYHLIKNPVIHDAVDSLIGRMPPQMHIIIAGRCDPPLSLARLRARGQLAELMADDLSFTHKETETVLNHILGLGLTEADISTLKGRTEGWITGLKLAALIMRVNKNTPVSAVSGSHRHIYDYLFGEVFCRQPEKVQSFLIRTSILECFTGPLCDAVTGFSGGHKMLCRLDRHNLFIVPLDGDRRWYRFHHLFADFLRGFLRLKNPDLLPALHKRAALWYEQNGLAARAVDHMLAAGNFEEAARLVEKTAQKMIMRNEVNILLNWIDRLPEEMMHSRPGLSIAYAWALTVTGQLNRVESILQHVKRQIPYGDTGICGNAVSFKDLAKIRSEMASMISSGSCDQGDVSRLTEIDRELERLMEYDSFFSRFMNVHLGIPYRMSDDLISTGRFLAEINNISRTAGNVFVTLAISNNLAYVLKLQGRLNQAAETYISALQFADDHGCRSLPVTGILYIGLGEIFYEWNRIEDAMTHLMAAMEKSGKLGNVDVMVWCNVTIAKIRHAQGDTGGAIELLDQSEQLLQKYNLANKGMGVYLKAYWARVLIDMGDMGGADRRLRECGFNRAGIGRGSLIDVFMHDIFYTTLALLLIKKGKHGRALELLDNLYKVAEEGKRAGSLIEIMALQALAYQAGGNLKQAKLKLEKVLLLGEPEGYCRNLVDKRDPMFKLLKRIVETGTNQTGHMKTKRGYSYEYVTRLLMTTRGLAKSLDEELSDREYEVLRLLDAGLSNKEIAAKLFVAKSTVKTHVNRIYSKFNVHSRTRAIAVARESGLL